MASPLGEQAIADATANGNALLKFISPNDAGVTQSHQCGFYLPKPAWEMFSPHPPERGRQDDEIVEILWQDGRTTQSRIVWYGQKTRSEYRLTRFGRDFPFLTGSNVGDLFVLIPTDHHHFTAYVLDLEEDIEDLLAALGVQPFERWGIYEGGAPRPETEDECTERHFRAFTEQLESFPTGEAFSNEAVAILRSCLASFERLTPDALLMRTLQVEYALFRFAERRLCQADIVRVFRDVDDFLQTAATIMNRRKSRAGRSLENHVHRLLSDAQIPHTMRSQRIPGKPDIVIPSEEAYLDPLFPDERLIVVGVKTTCKDRWRQVINEARRVSKKHIFTIQPGISSTQLLEMQEANITLIVPKSLHADYPSDSLATILDVSGFIESARAILRQ